MKQYKNYPTESKCGATRRSAWPPTRSLTLRSMILGILIFALAISPGAAFALTGNGTLESPYEISNAEELAEFRDIVNDGSAGAHAKLTKNITLSSENWTPIGKDGGTAYTGTFDGCGYKITGLEINRDEDNIGLFGVVTGGTVTNVHLVDVDISGRNYVGGVVGRSTEGSTVSNCTNSGNVSGMGLFSYYVGGIVGHNSGNGTVSNCANSGNVSGAVDYAGGVVGHNSGNGIVSNCANSGNVSNRFNHVGGIVGYNSGSVSNCTNSGNVSSENDCVGGICGSIESGGIVSNCTNFGEVSGGGLSVGGVVGRSEGSTVSNCTNSGEVSGAYERAGGIVGDNLDYATVSNCVNSGKVSGRKYVGGVIGYTYQGTVENCGYYKEEGSTQDIVGFGDDSGTGAREISAEELNAAIVMLAASIDTSSIPLGTSATIELNPLPGKPDAGAVTISDLSYDDNIVTVKQNDWTLTVMPRTQGSTTITFKATFTPTDLATIMSSTASQADAPVECEFAFPVTVTISDSNIALEGIELSQKELTLDIDKTANLSVIYNPDSATNKTVTWKSDDESIATVERTGEGTATVTAVTAGTTKITATSDDGWHTAECEVTVTPIYVTGVTISPDITESLYLDGSGRTFTAEVTPSDATYGNVTWSLVDKSGTLASSNAVNLANETGTSVTLQTTSAHEDGIVNLIATTVGTDANGNTLTASTTLNFQPPNVSGLALNEETLSVDMNIVKSAQLTATVSPSNAAYDKVTWTVSPEIVTLAYGDDKQTQAEITPTKGGEATITAAVGGYSDSCTLTVIPVYATGITLSQNELSLESGKSATLKATVTPDNATDKSVTWSSSNETVATIDENGIVTAHDAGTATITAKANGAKTALTGDCAVTVTKPPVPVENVTVTTKDGKAEQELAKGATLKLTVEITPSNATNPAVTWHSSNGAVATVSADGTVTAVGPGTATITATSADGSIQSNAIIITVPGSTDTPVTPETPTEPTAPQGSGGGGGGCSAGFGALALLAIAPLALKRRK